MDLEEKSTSPSACRAKRQKLSFPKAIRLESVLPDDLTAPIPLVDVFVAAIKDPKSISKVILTLNSKLPVVELQHLKRIRAGREVLLCPCSWVTCGDSSPSIVTFLASKEVNIDHIDIENVTTTKVASLPPKTKRQYMEMNKIWPCNFHSNKYTEQLIENSLFSPKELELHTKLLRLALGIGKFSQDIGANKRDCSGECGVIITDPLRADMIIAAGYSMMSDNPILHSTMVAIDGVARTQHGGAYNHLHFMENMSWKDLLIGEFEELTVLQRHQEAKTEDNSILGQQEDIKIDQFRKVEHKHGHELNDSEYLCTNYHVYMTHEPCTMCAMALIHSRAKRVFYIYPSPNGALATKCKIHAVKDLNHHYEVFKVKTEDLEYFATK